MWKSVKQRRRQMDRVTNFSCSWVFLSPTANSFVSWVWETAPSLPIQPSLSALSHNGRLQKRFLFFTAVRKPILEVIFPSFTRGVRCTLWPLGDFILLLWRIVGVLSKGREDWSDMNVHISSLKVLISLQPYKDPNGLCSATDLRVRNQIPKWTLVQVN